MKIGDAILQRLATRTMRMRQALDRFDDASAESEPVGPNWNVRDLAGHFVYWSELYAVRIGLLAAGHAVPVLDHDLLNADAFRKNRRMSFVMLLPQLRDAENRLNQVIRSVPERLLIDTPVRDEIESALDHYDHHWPGLKDAGERAGAR